MSVNYIEIDGKKVIKDHQGAACYYSIMCGSICKETTELLLNQPDNTFCIPLDMIQQWVDTINKCGFPCKYLGKNHKLAKKYHIDENHHLFHIDIADKYVLLSHLSSTLTLLRYMFEEIGFAAGIKEFYKIRKEVKLKHISNFRNLLMCFHYMSGNSNHMLHSTGGAYDRTFSTKKQVFDAFEKGPKIYDGQGSNLYKCWEIGEPIITNCVIKDYNKLYKYMNKQIKKRVYVVGGDLSYANWLDNYKPINKLEDAELVLFTGGEDVHPSLYGEPMGANTGSNLARDIEEQKIYKQAKKLGLPCLGICRGSQFLCVMNGGKLVQHQENNSRIHPIFLTNGGQINITSTHHQAAYPFNKDMYSYKILGYTRGISKFHLDGEGNELAPEKECEIVYYRQDGYNGNDLGIQGHPEFADYQCDPANTESIKELKNIFLKFVNEKY